MYPSAVPLALLAAGERAGAVCAEAYISAGTFHRAGRHLGFCLVGLAITSPLAQATDWVSASQTALENNDPLAAQQLLRMAAETPDTRWIQAALDALVFATPAQFLPNGRHPLITRDSDYVLMIRDGQVVRHAISTGEQTTLYAESDAIDLAIQANNAVVILTPDAVHLWRASGHRSSFKLTRNTDSQALSEDGNTVTASRGGHAWRWDVSTPKPRPISTDLSEASPSSDSAQPPGQRWLAVEDTAGIALYDTHAPAGSPRFALHETAITDLVCAPGSRRMFSTAADGTVLMTRLQDPSRPLPLFGHQAASIRLVLSPDQSLIVSHGDHSARVWTADKGSLFRVLHHESPVYATALNHDNSNIATAAADGLHLWSQVEPVAIALDGAVSDLRFSDDGTRLLFALDGVASQVDVPQLRRVSSAAKQTPHPIPLPYRFPGIEQQTTLSACDDGLQWLFGTETGEVHLRTTQPKTLLAYLQQAEPCMDPARRQRYLDESAPQAADRWQTCMDRTGPEEGRSDRREGSD
ncbi:MAG: hypothetical protein GWP91_15940 [Rhodobacterales bacterium]|nr:hypothetical protein [Rhodobacterales bacterium]